MTMAMPAYHNIPTTVVFKPNVSSVFFWPSCHNFGDIELKLGVWKL